MRQSSKCKVLLINPPLSPRFPSPSCYPPLGLASIASVLLENDFDVDILDAAVLNAKIDTCVTKSLGYDIVGITAMTPAYPQTLRMAEQVKRRSKDVFVCIGGPHATFMSEQVLRTGFFDVVVRGEGELTFLELCQALREEKNFQKIPGISFRKGNRIVHNAPRAFIHNLDELPFPAYHLLPINAYQDRYPPSLIRRKPWLTYCGSRGCPFRCKFCSSSALWGRIWRGLSVERMIEDLQYLLTTYDLRSLFFVDDNFTFNRKRAIRLCQRIIQQKLDFEWVCNCRVDQVDLEVLQAMHSAGCWRIGFGIESGSQQVIDWYGKGFRLTQARKTVRLCQKVGISPIGYFIVGAPIEDESMILRTIEFAKQLDLDAVGFSFAVPFPGSQLYDYVKREGLILTHDWELYGQDIPVTQACLATSRLKELISKAYRDFYFRPGYMLRCVWKFRDLSYLTKGLGVIFKWIRRS